jgi:hypothetical protein
MEEIDIWRAAKQMLDRYPDGAEMAAAQRADKAYEEGDMFNFNLWRRITKAVGELLRQKPSSDEAVN